MLSLKHVPSIALSHFCPIHSSYKEANLTASRKRGKQLSLPSAKDFFSSVFAKSPATKSLCSDHGNKPCPWDDWRFVLDHEKSKQALHLHSAGQIICAESRAGTANYVRKRSSCWDRCIQEKKCYAAILYSVSKERQLVVQPSHEQFNFRCLFLHGHWNVSWGPHGAEHTVWLQDVTGGDIGTIMHPGASDFHLALLLYADEKSLTGISPGPGRTCTKLDTNTVRGKSFLITEPGAFPCDLLLSKKAGKSLLRGKYQTDGHS